MSERNPDIEKYLDGHISESFSADGEKPDKEKLKKANDKLRSKRLKRDSEGRIIIPEP